ncbi:MAG: efflux RND transporter periplasmic adaptor subunit [Pseudomonadota bacterium]
MPAAVREGRSMISYTVSRRSGLLLAACALLAGCSKEKPAPPTPEAGFVVMRTESVPLFIELPGRTAAFETSEIRPQVTGVLKARLFTEGSLVRAGQTLYQIDPSLFRASVNQAAASLANARAQREATAARAQRLKPLAQIEAVSKQDYTDAVAAARQADASIAQNAALLDTARINLRFTSVPAPISGRIGRSLVTTGALVTAGQAEALTTIQRLDPIFVDIQQSSADLIALRRQLAAGKGVASSATVTLKLEDGSSYPATGRLEFAEAMVDPETGTVTLRARFPNPDGLLLPGMFVRANMSQLTARDAILVPQAGVTRNPKGEATVVVVGAGNKAELRTIVADRTVGDKWLATSGLKAGDKVIVEGLGKIKPGQPIRPVPAGSPVRKAAPGGPAKAG